MPETPSPRALATEGVSGLPSWVGLLIVVVDALVFLRILSPRPAGSRCSPGQAAVGLTLVADSTKSPRWYAVAVELPEAASRQVG